MCIRDRNQCLPLTSLFAPPPARITPAASGTKLGSNIAYLSRRGFLRTHACPWSGSRSPDQGLFCVQLRSFSANRTGREEYQGRTKKGLARNKCALLTRGKPSNRRKLRILLHSFSAWLTPPKQVTSAPDLAQDTRSGAFYFAFPHPAACPRFDQCALRTGSAARAASLPGPTCT